MLRFGVIIGAAPWLIWSDYLDLVVWAGRYHQRPLIICRMSVLRRDGNGLAHHSCATRKTTDGRAWGKCEHLIARFVYLALHWVRYELIFGALFVYTSSRCVGFHWLRQSTRSTPCGKLLRAQLIVVTGVHFCYYIVESVVRVHAPNLTFTWRTRTFSGESWAMIS